MADSSRRSGMRVAEFVAALPIGRSAFYDLPAEQRPRSARLGRVQIIIESPSEYLERLAAEQREPQGLYQLADRRHDGTRRVIATFANPADANAALTALRTAGSLTARLDIVPSVDPLAPGSAP